MKNGPGVGRKYNLNSTYENVKIELSTVDQRPLRSLTLETRFWYLKDPNRNTKFEINKMFNKCKRVLQKQNRDVYYTDKIISIKDLPLDLESKTEKVFTIFEFTLFVKNKFENASHLIQVINPIIDELYQDVFLERGDVSKRKI